MPWNLAITAALGVWLMAAPALLGATGFAANNNYLAGALIVTWSVMAFGEIARPVRLLNIPLGTWLLLAPWLLEGATGLVVERRRERTCAIVTLSVRRGPIEERFGAWNRYLFW